MTKKVTPRLVVAILSAGMLSFLGILDETATTVTFPILTKEFVITTDQVQWVNTLVLLVIATIVPISSQIRLRIPTKRIFILGVSLFLLGLVIDVFTPWFALLLVGRAMQGIGTGIGLPLMYNIILAEVPKEKLGFMMGIGTMITACAVAFGPVFGGIVTDALNWRWIFIISLFLIIISLITGIWSIRQINPLQKVKIKFGQWLSLAVALVCLMLSFTQIAKYSFLSVPVLGFLLLGIASLLIWLKISWSDKGALISPKLFKNLRFSMQLIAYSFAKIATLALGFIFPIYVELVNKGSVSLAGWITFPGAVVNALMAAIAGKLFDKKGARLPIIVGVIASLTSLVLMNLLPSLSNLAIVLLYVLYYGGYGMCFGSLMTSGLITLGESHHAQGNAIFNTLQQFSGALGTALAGTLIAIAQNKHGGNSTAIGSKWTFMVLLVLVSINLVLGLCFVPKKQDRKA